MSSTGSTSTANKNARSRTFPGRCTLVATICLAGLCGAAVWAGTAPGTSPAVISTPETPAAGGRFVVFDLLPPPPAPPAAPGPSMVPNDASRPNAARKAPESRPLRRPADVGNELEGLSRQEVVPVTGQEYPVDLSTVLRLAEAREPDDRPRARGDPGGPGPAASGPRDAAPIAERGGHVSRSTRDFASRGRSDREGRLAIGLLWRWRLGGRLADRRHSRSAPVWARRRRVFSPARRASGRKQPRRRLARY